MRKIAHLKLLRSILSTGVDVLVGAQLQRFLLLLGAPGDGHRVEALSDKRVTK
jgi:hypothetical protein